MRRRIRERLLELSPRAFEFFAGDLLVYLGLESVSVTRQTGDGGIDAVCEMVSGGHFRVPAGVQVKRQRQSVARPEMDRFIGALANRFPCGIFVTTATFTRPSLQKAAISVPHVSTVDGDQIADVMVTNGIGTNVESDSLDERYFGIFESRLKIAEESAVYDAGTPREVTPADDLISLRALSYALRVDTTTIRDWIERGRLQPDAGGDRDNGDGLYFRRHRINEIREKFKLRALPRSADEWLDGFLSFAIHGTLNKSYKPVMLLAMLDLARSDGTVDEDALAEAFHDFYVKRSSAGLAAEAANSILSQPEKARPADVKRLLVRYPLERFVIKGFMEHRPNEHLIRFRPEVWNGLRFRDVLELRRSLLEQIERYFSSIRK